MCSPIGSFCNNVSSLIYSRCYDADCSGYVSEFTNALIDEYDEHQRLIEQRNANSTDGDQICAFSISLRAVSVSCNILEVFSHLSDVFSTNTSPNVSDRAVTYVR